jgi:hypothetical protein
MMLPKLRPGGAFPGSAFYNELSRTANAAQSAQSTHGAQTETEPPPLMLPVVVIAREIDGQSPGDDNAGSFLSAHAYTVAAFGQIYEIDHTALIVPVQPGLIDVSDPEGTEQVFTPAAVFGDDVAEVYPWRARGELFRFPIPNPGGAPTAGYACKLYGLAPHRGC